MEIVIRELTAAKREMMSCPRVNGEGCPAAGELGTIRHEDLHERTRSANLTRISVTIASTEGCFGADAPCRPHYLLKDVFLRLVR